ncbi:MAG: hypothetical protein B5M56_01095 [Desulfococcus sp. 4484_241]|nr:MAG: hypothetical protein B5M56_01095 [Desulfococcus sp. 4484_241]
MDAGMTPDLLWKAAEVARAAEGRLLSGSGETHFDRIVINSRLIEEKDLFVAIKGTRHDGHDFVAEVIGKGVRGVVVEHSGAPALMPMLESRGAVCVAVEDTTVALGRLARYRRRIVGPKVVAITGTSGKTTTRAITEAVCGRACRVLATHGNLNNAIGLPLTLLRLEMEHQLAILELGTNSPGEIAALAEICEPDIGVVLNVGPGHLQGLGSVEGVAREKGTLLEALDRESGVAVLNFDDPLVSGMADRASCRVIGYGLSKRADVRALSVKRGQRWLEFELFIRESGERVDVRLPCAGMFMVSNALAAAAVGCTLGIGAQEIKAGLERFVQVPGRMAIRNTRAGFTVVDDSYNANPSSVAAAISGLIDLKGDGRGILVMGDMLELGDHAADMHGKTGAVAVESGVDMICATGDFAKAVADGAVSAGMAPEKIITGSKDKIVNCLRSVLRDGDWVLVKGSRAMRMESVVSDLLALGDGGCTKGEDR